MLLGAMLILIASTGATVAQTLSVSYKNQSLEAVLADLKQKTNYNFVYQKQIVQGANRLPLTLTMWNFLIFLTVCCTTSVWIMRL